MDGLNFTAEKMELFSSVWYKINSVSVERHTGCLMGRIRKNNVLNGVEVIMDEKDWLILKILAEKMSITQTAQALSMTQPSLSSRIQQMEERFRTDIVIRSKRGVEFTPEGLLIVQAAMNFLKQTRDLEDKLKDLGDKPSGVLRIASTPFFSKAILPELLFRFKQRYENIDFDVTTCSSADAVEKIANMEVNVAFVRGEYPWQGGKKLLFSENIYICSKEPIDLKRLPQIPQIDYPNAASAQALQEKWWKEHFSVDPYIGMRVDNPETCYEMVAKGLGYAYLTTLFLKRGDRFHAYELKLKNGKPLIRNTWIYYHEAGGKLLKVKALLDFWDEIDLLAVVDS